MKKLFLILNGLLIGLFLSYFLTLKPALNLNKKIIITPSDKTNKEYLLTQKYNLYDLSAARSIPTVYEKPGTNKYKFVLLKEYLDSFGNYDQLFFASKRIAELERWGKEIDWKKSLNQYKKHVIAYWKGINENNEQIKYPEFKATLQSHYRLLEELIFIQSDNPELNILKIQYVDQIFDQFKELIPKDTVVSAKGLYYPLFDIAKNKEYGIYNISSQAKNNYNYLQYIQLSIKDHAYYPQITDSEDKESKQITFNNVLIDKTNSQSSVINIALPELRNKILKWTESFNKASPNPYINKTLLNNFSSGDYKINITYAFKNPAIIRIEEQVATTESKLRYRIDSLYQQIIYPHVYSHIFTDSFHKKENNEKILDIYLNIESEKELTLDEINSISVYFTPVIPLELNAHKISDLPDNKLMIKPGKINNREYKITTINLTKDQDQKILDALGFGWITIDQAQNKNQSEYIVLYWPKYAIGFMTFILIIITIGVIFYTKELYRAILYYLKFYWEKTVTYPLYFLWRIFQYICSSIRFVLFLLVMLGLFIDILIIQGSNDVIILLFTSLWILTLIGYNVEARINFVFTLIFLVLCPLLLILKLDPIAKTSAIWAYMFLVLGTFQSIIEMRFEIKGLTKYSEFLKKIPGYSILQSVSLILIKVLLSLLNLIKQIIFRFSYFLTCRIILTFKYLHNILKRIINNRPRSAKDLLLYLIKITFVLSLFILVVTLIIAVPVIIGFATTRITIATHEYIIYYQKKLRDKNFKEDRKLLDPVIEKVEPSIVYPSTKVIVFGKGFNSRADNNKYLNMSVLRSQGSSKEGNKITTDYWDDNKIIFTVPLHWKNGINHIWIDKPIIWDGKEDVAKSNVVSIKLIPISQTFTPDDDEYFKLLPSYDKETLKINGYE